LCLSFRPWILGLFFSTTCQSLHFLRPILPFLLWVIPSAPNSWLILCVHACVFLCLCFSLSMLLIDWVSLSSVNL
jgi:hypothetical protein